MLSSPRRPATTIRIFSSAEYCLRVRRRMARTVASAPSFKPFNFWLIFVPFGRCDEPEILRYANPSICSVGADVRHLGPAPSLNCLRSRKRGLVRRLHRYYGRIRLPPAVHHRIGAFRLADADRPGGRARAASRWISRFPCRWLPRVQEVSGPRRAEVALAVTRHPVLPSAFLHSVGAPDGNFSRLNTPPACSPVNASCPPSAPVRQIEGFRERRNSGSS